MFVTKKKSIKNKFSCICELQNIFFSIRKRRRDVTWNFTNTNELVNRRGWSFTSKNSIQTQQQEIEREKYWGTRNNAIICYCISEWLWRRQSSISFTHFLPHTFTKLGRETYDSYRAHSKKRGFIKFFMMEQRAKCT